GENDRWLRLPGRLGSYRLQVSAGWQMGQKLVLLPGEAMLMQLSGGGRRPVCERVLYSEQEAFRLRPRRGGGDWTAAGRERGGGERVKDAGRAGEEAGAERAGARPGEAGDRVAGGGGSRRHTNRSDRPLGRGAGLSCPRLAGGCSGLAGLRRPRRAEAPPVVVS